LGLGLADFNGDGHMDVMGADTLANLQLYLGDGSGSLSSPVTKAGLGSNMDYPYNSIAEDVDGDGDIDFVQPNIGGSTLRVLRNDGSGNFNVQSTLSLSDSSYYLKLADLNGDDADDIIASTPSGFSIFLGNGAGQFGSEITIASEAADVMGFGIGDFNGDGAIDLAGTLRGESKIGVFEARTRKSSGLTDIDFRNSEEAGEFLQIVDNAIAEIQSKMDQVSLIHSQLDLQQARSLSMTEALEDARSRVSDVDLATETAELVRLQILQQAQVAAATQANLSQRVVLELLRF
jgi:flagellin-like hook-associated protein FlgL